MSKQTHHAVILGGGYAGIMAAQRLASTGAQVTLINNRNTFVERIRLHQRAVGQRIVRHQITDLLRANVRFILGHVQAIDPGQRRVVYAAGDHAAHVEYDSLVYTLGSTIRLPKFLAGQPFVYTLNADSVDALHARLGALDAGARLVVSGGGLTGIEGATELAEAYPHLRVTLLTSGVLGEGLSERGRAYLYQTFERMGIEIREHTRAYDVKDGVLVTNRAELPFDACLWAGGFSALPLARDAGIAVNERSQIVVDSHLRSVSHPEIYAAGDAAYIRDYPLSIRMACATAIPMGAHAASSVAAKMTGKKPQPFGFRYFFQCISLGRQDGLIQLVNVDDTPRDQVITGRASAMFKEMICRVAFNSLRFERYFPGMYHIPPVREVARGVRIV